jgi:hypothetical protein
MAYTRWRLMETRGPWEAESERQPAGLPAKPSIVGLAEIWPPFDAASGVIQNPTPVGDEVIAQVERTGYVVVAPVEDYEPYTHVISTGNHDYLAAISLESMPGETL